MISTIITPMNFTLARDFICQHLANERENQKKLALQMGAEENWVLQNIDFVIFPKRFRYPDVEDMPCVYVYFNEMAFPESGQDAYNNEADANLVVDFFTVGLNDEADSVNERTADENAEDRLEYLSAQVYKMLCSEESNIYAATGKLVRGLTLKDWKRIKTPDNDNTAGTILGARFEFNVQFAEPTYYAKTYEIKELYVSLNVNNQFISPFVRHILNKE